MKTIMFFLQNRRKKDEKSTNEVAFVTAHSVEQRKLLGQKPPLQPKHIWSTKTQLQLADKVRDLALFNLAIDSKLRACDVDSILIENIAPHGHAIDRATIHQRITGRPVKFELTEQTRTAIDEFISKFNIND